MADDPGKHAVDVVARHMVAAGTHDNDDVWGLYPEIGEHDWNDVLDRADQIAVGIRPTDDAYEAAYEFLSSRADPEA